MKPAAARTTGQDEERTAYSLAVVQPESGELIGEIGLVDISWPNRRAALSLLVLSVFRRAGVGREAIELVVGWAQPELARSRPP
jgi:RimJ/RimL family protein N-acetyltransferase